MRQAPARHSDRVTLQVVDKLPLRLRAVLPEVVPAARADKAATGVGLGLRRVGPHRGRAPEVGVGVVAAPHRRLEQLAAVEEVVAHLPCRAAPMPGQLKPTHHREERHEHPPGTGGQRHDRTLHATSTGLHLAEGQLVAHGELRKHVEVLQELLLLELTGKRRAIPPEAQRELPRRRKAVLDHLEGHAAHVPRPLVERLHLSVDRSGARPYERAVVDVDGHGEGEHPHAPRHVHDDVHKESFEGPRHPCRAEVTEDVGEQRHLGILRASVEAEEKERPDVGMKRQHREGCLHVRHPHAVVELEEPGDLLVSVEGMP